MERTRTTATTATDVVTVQIIAIGQSEIKYHEEITSSHL